MARPLTRLIEGTGALAPLALLEDEFAKDRWDVRNIPGVRYPPHRNDHYIIFTGIPEPFRQLIKDHIQFLLAAGRAAKTLIDHTRCLERFFTFFLSRYANATALQVLSEQDIDVFVVHLKAEAHTRTLKREDVYIWNHIHALELLLSYLERIQSPLKPREPTLRIIWPHHYPRWKKSGTERAKYIPRTVLDQLDRHLNHLRPTYIPIVLLLRASGWRISDVLYLKMNTCLEQESLDKYWLVGDIQKTQVLDHKIPITTEVAAIVLAQIEWVKQHYTPEENPKGWLFPASKKNRHRTSPRFLQGETLAVTGISETLNRLATTYQIQDEQGNTFHFKSHAFRHTKAVELINNGMSLVMVQQWMAHASPEMTLIYAKILDETMRTQWEKTVQQGIVQFNDGKPEYISGKKLLPMASSNAFDPKRVREHRQNVKMALGSCLKTAKIVCKFVELPCFHCPAYVLTPNDLPALQAYEQHILERIEIGKQAGNAHWIDVNQRNLDERVRPAIALLRQGNIVAKSEKDEREYTDEEWAQRTPHGKEGGNA
jgi:integrase